MGELKGASSDAARRALALSRGTIVDLSCSHAPTVGAALQSVADELAQRHRVRVNVDADEPEMHGAQRDDLIRIAREAINNAVQHGNAREITITLGEHRDRLVLRVDDDGCGISDGVAADPGRGFGLRAMHERAAALGGRLAARACVGGGTQVEVVVCSVS